MATITGNSATTERDRTSGDISLVREAIARFTDTDVHRATRQLSHRELDRLSSSLVLPKRALTEGAGVSRLLRNRVAARRDTWARRVACDLSSGSLRRIVEALGPNHADPSFDELAMAVESLLGELGGTVIGLVLAMAVDQGFQAAPHCRHLLRTDPRLTPSAPTDDGACDRAPIRSDEDRAVDRQEVLEARLARKRATKLRRAPRARRERRPRRYRRAKHAPVPTHTAPDSVVTPQGSAASSTLAPTRRPVRSVVFDDGASYADPLVGSVIWSTIRFTGGRRGSKRRPCVVIAASGRRHLVVRPCYSEGGLQTRRWKSVEVLDLSAAGLDRRSWVAPEEHRVPRRDARRIAGRLATGDWNML